MVKKLPAMQGAPVRFLGQEDSPGEGIAYLPQYPWASLVVQTVKNLTAIRETRVRSLGQEDPFGEGHGCPF